MKTFALASTIALTIFSGQAMAACTEGSGWKKMNAAGSGGSLALSTLTGKTVCVGSAPTWDAQEYHQLGGALIDYKRGSTDKIDPTSQVGTWSIVGDKIRHYYGPGADYTYDVYENKGSYSFCVGASEKAAATIKTGQVGC